MIKIVLLFATCVAIVHCRSIETWRFDKYRNMSSQERDIVIQIALDSNSKINKANYMAQQLDSKLGASGHFWTCLYVADPSRFQWTSTIFWLKKSFSLKQKGHGSYDAEIIYCTRLYLD